MPSTRSYFVDSQMAQSVSELAFHFTILKDRTRSNYQGDMSFLVFVFWWWNLQRCSLTLGTQARTSTITWSIPLRLRNFPWSHFPWYQYYYILHVFILNNFTEALGRPINRFHNFCLLDWTNKIKHSSRCLSFLSQYYRVPYRSVFTNFTLANFFFEATATSSYN